MLLLLLAGMIGQQVGDPMAQVEYARLSYKANKDAFAFGTFRFEYTIGVSASRPDAEAGVFTQSIREDGLYVFDGNNARYELTAEPEAMAAVTRWMDERRSSSIAMVFRMLTDGKVTLLDQIHQGRGSADLLHQPQIFAGTVVYRQRFDFPLFLGDQSDRPYDLFGNLSWIKAGTASLAELDAEASLNGLKLCKISFNYKEGKCTYWLDLNRGAVPLRILDHYNPTDVEVTYDFSDLVEVPNAGWMPRKMVHIIGNGISVVRLVVTSVDAGNKPPSTAFKLDFPEPVRLPDKARKLVYPRGKTWSLLRLPGRSSAGTTPLLPTTYVPPDQLPGEIEGGPPWFLLVSVGVVSLLVLGSILTLRRRKKRLRRG